jgi:hypothetical protein
MDHNDYEPCETCVAVINDTLDGYKDNAIQEDELEGGDALDYTYPLPFEEKHDE